MQAYRLTIDREGKVAIPQGEPGQTVTVLVEESRTASELKPVSGMSQNEKEAFRLSLFDRASKISERHGVNPPLDHGDELYGKDGLPK